MNKHGNVAAQNNKVIGNLHYNENFFKLGLSKFTISNYNFLQILYWLLLLLLVSKFCKRIGLKQKQRRVLGIYPPCCYCLFFLSEILTPIPKMTGKWKTENINQNLVASLRYTNKNKYKFQTAKITHPTSATSKAVDHTNRQKSKIFHHNIQEVQPVQPVQHILGF